MSDICQVCMATTPIPLVTQGGYDWVKCADCGFAWITPMPTPDSSVDGDNEIIGQSYIQKYLAKLDKKMRRSRHRVRALKRRMPGPRLLDIGCNIGCVVEAGRELGLEATGVEINPVLVDEAQRRFPSNRFIAAAFEEAGLEPASFGGVYTSEVIEHVFDTNRFLAAVHEVLVPGGVLYLTTPALREYVRGGEPKAWRDFGAPHHKLYFSPDNMRRMLAKHGFERIHIKQSFGRGIKLFARRP